MLTAIIDKHRTGEFNFMEKGHEDYQLWLELTRNGGYCITIQEILAQYSAGSSTSVSSNKLRAALWHWNIMSREPIPFHIKLINFFTYLKQGIKKNI